MAPKAGANYAVRLKLFLNPYNPHGNLSYSLTYFHPLLKETKMSDINRNDLAKTPGAFRRHVFGDRLQFNDRPVVDEVKVDPDVQAVKDLLKDDGDRTAIEVLVKLLHEYERLDSMEKHADKYVHSEPRLVYAKHEEVIEYPRMARALLAEIEKIANAIMITDEGNPDFGAILVLEKEGFSVVAGETDSFGWLTGVIRTRCGRILFG